MAVPPDVFLSIKNDNMFFQYINIIFRKKQIYCKITIMRPPELFFLILYTYIGNISYNSNNNKTKRKIFILYSNLFLI